MQARLQGLILEMIAKGDPARDVFDALCRGAEALSSGAICSILAVDRDGRVHPLAAPSLPQGFSDAIDGLPIGPSAGSCGTAAWRGRPVEVDDVTTDPLWADYRALAAPLGIRACWSSPIFSPAGSVVGTFAFYYREPRGPTATEREIVSLCTDLCAITLERETRRREIERLAFFDAMTGLGNRASFDAALAAHDYGQEPELALLIIDIDDLKIVNDTFGARVGDRLLGTIAQRIRETAGPTPAYRLAGDEFALIVTGADAVAECEALAGRLLRAVHHNAACEGHRLTPSATIGLAVRCPTDIGGALVRQNAYLALYDAKERARGRFVRYHDEQRARIAARLRVIGDLHKALGEGRVRPHYQPIVDLASGRIVGVEALARVHRPDGRIVPAAEFQEALADGNTAARISRAMISQVARDLQGWRDHGIAPPHTAVNLSTADFVDGSLALRIEDLLCPGPRPLEGIVVEITESVYLGRTETGLLDHIERLKEKGAKIALDDFGTGFASLTHLLTMPIDILKIDQSFVKGLDDHGAPIIDGLLRITEKLGLRVVAEGVESEAQRHALLRLGCTLGQGWLFAPALDHEAITRLLAAQGHGQAPVPRRAA